jgi:hypothetical protein
LMLDARCFHCEDRSTRSRSVSPLCEMLDAGCVIARVSVGA